MIDSRTAELAHDILPSQWSDRQGPSPEDLPERRLLVAVLLDAVRLLHHGNAGQRAEVVAWVRGLNGSARIPFGFLCECLAIEPEKVARDVLQIDPRKAAHRRVRVQNVRSLADRVVKRRAS